MKKAKALVLMLTICMLTTCLVGGTVARFVAQDSTRDTAKTAKWGVVLLVSGNLYGTKYQNAASGNTAVAGDSNITVRSNSVSALDSSLLNVVAPGTRGGSMRLSLSGTPEVATLRSLEITAQSIYLAGGIYGEMAPANNVTVDNIDAAITEGLYINQGSASAPSYQKITVAPSDFVGIQFYRVENRFELTSDYYPVLYTAPGLDISASCEQDTLSELAKALAEAIAGAALESADPNAAGQRTYSVTGKRTAPNTALDLGLNPVTAINTGRLVIDWSWAIDNGATDAARAAYRSADTLLGKLSADNRTAVVLDQDGKASLLAVDAESGVIKNAVGTQLGSIKTSLELSLTVEQVD